MSQLLVPTNGGVVPQIATTTESQNRLKVFSPQYVTLRGLQGRPTEWVPGGRPIYRRLPGTSETYQINFFNVVTESNILGNTTTIEGIEEVGYVFVPYGSSINGSISSEVISSDSKQDILVKSGSIVWKYGKVDVLPTIANLRVLEVTSGVYDIAYQLIYDDSPVPKLYEVSDFALTGLPLNITSSTDSILGWRYGAVNAFLNNSNNFWSNEDSFFPSYAQPATAFLQWESDFTEAYSSIVLRCPPGTAHSGTATLFYVNGSTLVSVSEVEISKDGTGQFFQLDIENAEFQSGWKVVFSDTKMSIQSITVSGSLTLLESQASLSPRAALVMYPKGTLPKTVTNSQNKEVPATYCKLAEVSVDSTFSITKISDTRTIIHRDYVPVADWLTAPFDEDLIDLYETVSEYVPLWMAPTSCLKYEYAELSSDQIAVEK